MQLRRTKLRKIFYFTHIYISGITQLSYILFLCIDKFRREDCTIFRLILAFFASAIISTEIDAKELRIPDGQILLTISGRITQTNINDTAVFDLELLKELPSEMFTTTTIWTDGPQEFEGVPLAELAKLVGFAGNSLKASAVNDYTISIPISDAAEGRALVAYQRNGRPMPLRDKGPLWIVYPYDSSPEFQSETIYSRSIWQLDRIFVSE